MNAFQSGVFMFTIISTSLEPAFAMGVVNSYMSNLDKKHWEVVKGIMRYLRHTKSMHICCEN